MIRPVPIRPVPIRPVPIRPVQIRAVFWDVGNVLLQWDLRLLYRDVFDDHDEMEWFLANVWTPAHNVRCDAGESFEQVIAEVVAQHPDYAPQIHAAFDRWPDTVPGPIDGMLDVLTSVHDAGIAQFGLTNFSTETFPLVGHYPHFALLDDSIVSGVHGVVKPDPRIYRIALDVAGVAPEEVVFFDDSELNVEGARAVGIHAALFVDAASAIEELVTLGVLAGEAQN